MGDRPANFNEKKSDRELEQKIRSYLLEEQHENFLAAVRKCDPPQEFDAKGENTRTTRLHDTLSVP